MNTKYIRYVFLLKSYKQFFSIFFPNQLLLNRSAWFTFLFQLRLILMIENREILHRYFSLLDFIQTEFDEMQISGLFLAGLNMVNLINNRLALYLWPRERCERCRWDVVTSNQFTKSKGWLVKIWSQRREGEGRSSDKMRKLTEIKSLQFGW